MVDLFISIVSQLFAKYNICADLYNKIIFRKERFICLFPMVLP
nr:MAG TPA: hypothetical protein [Caudoviricetes sp.]